jgi:hypothetical protein
MRPAAILLAVFTFFSAPTFASIGLVVGELYGNFGTVLPVGHAGIYLDHLCADPLTCDTAGLASSAPSSLAITT